MNWREIKKKYPKAYRKLRKWVYLLNSTWYNNIFEQYYNKSDARYEFIQTLNNHTDCVFNQHRDLYDFFDGQGVVVTPLYDAKFKWYYKIETSRIRFSVEPYKTRTEAEQEAFTKAFEILENKLK